jgi:hypothetical protein
MSWTDKRSRIARLQRAQRRWAWEDRSRGYTTYRNGRPHYTVSSRRVGREKQQLKETVLIVCVLAIAGVAAGMGIGGRYGYL